MTGRFVRLMVVCFSAILLAGCLSVNVHKTENESKDVTATSEK